MKRRLIASLLMLTLTATGALWWFLRPTRITFLTDADTIRESAASASLREVLWQRPSPLLDLINTNADEFEPRVSADGGTLFFVRGKPGHNADIYACTRVRAGWSSPTALAEINSEHDELGPDPSADGQALYFYSDRPGGLGGYDLWVTRKGEHGWQPPTNLGNAVNSGYNEYGSALSPDGRTLCFSSNRPKPGEASPSDDAWRATVREDLYRHDYDLYSANISDAGLQPAAPIDALNSPYNDGAPAYSPIGDFFYFSSDRPVGHGGFDIYRARILRERFQPPTNLGTAVNTAANELDPALDVGGYALHFSSDRPVSDSGQFTKGAADSSHPTTRYHLYHTFSREVFHDVEVRQPVIAWAELWKQIGPNLMWALLALIVFILLLALMRDLSRRRLSLLARCLIISLMVHMLLMLWFNAVQVSATIAKAIRKSGPIQVALSPAARSGDLAMQIRGGLTQTDVPPAAAPQLDRAAPTITAAVSTTPVEMPVERIAAESRESSFINARVVDASPRAIFLPTRHNVTADLSPAVINYTLPEDQSRSNTSEESEAAPASVESMKIAHYSMQVSTSQPAVPPQRVELAVEKTGAGPDSSHSFVANGPPSDAKPSAVTPALMQTALTAAVLGATNTIEPALPTAGIVSRQTSGEVASVPAADITAPPRAGGAIVSTLSAHPVAIHQLQPDAVALAASQHSFIASPGVIARDANPGFGSSLQGVSGASLTIAAASSPGGTGSTIDFALPSGEPRARTSNTEIATISSDSTASGVLAPLSRAGIPLSGITAPATIVRLTPATSPTPGAHSLLVGGRPSGAGVAKESGTGLSAIRIPVGSASSLPLPFGLPTSADPSAVAIHLPDETSPPHEQTSVIEIQPPTPAVGNIHGRVSDDDTGERLANARIQLDLPGGATMIVSTDATGTYQLAVPELPDFFALSASKPGYLPKTRNVANRAVVGRSMRLNFALKPQSLQIVALEDSPVIHHLGNDAYEGRINSQFQRAAEGRTYSGVFELSADQLPVGQAEVELLAKGVQCPHKIKINGHLLAARLGDSPRDGSFGPFAVIFDASLLRVGTNTLEIRAIACNGDLDDFEFINLQIRLLPQSH